MSIKARIEYLKEIYLRYKNSSRAEKTKILDEFTLICKYNRKYAIRQINEFPKELKKKPGPTYKYNQEVISPLLNRFFPLRLPLPLYTNKHLVLYLVF